MIELGNIYSSPGSSENPFIVRNETIKDCNE